MNDKDLQREYEQIGARIRNARIEQKMSQADLAAKANISLPHISAIELGKTKMLLSTFIRVIEALQISADSVLRANVPAVTSIYTSEISELFEDCSGTSTKHRDEFNRMIAECKAGKIDLVITKSVSRFARNVVDFLGMVRMLSERNPPIGVFFEAENIFSLNETSNMALSFQATMAEEESRNKSRSMETSLRMRLDHGLPLTPKLLGFSHDSEGKLIPNPDTMHIPKLMFYMYLYGYSTQQIADALTALEKKTYLGNVKWSSAGVAATLRNERYSVIGDHL